MQLFKKECFLQTIYTFALLSFHGGRISHIYSCKILQVKKTGSDLKQVPCPLYGIYEAPPTKMSPLNLLLVTVNILNFNSVNLIQSNWHTKTSRKSDSFTNSLFIAFYLFFFHCHLLNKS